LMSITICNDLNSHMVDATDFYGEEAHNDPLRAEFEGARALLDGEEWRRGLDELESLAYRGSMLSTLCVAGCMLEGWGYDQDLPGAEAWYRVAVESGFAAGLFGLGITHIRMGRFSEASEELQHAVSRNCLPAYNALAYLYSRGDGVPIDRQKALNLWRRGASQGHLTARRWMIWALIHGYGGLRGRFEGVLDAFPLALEIARAKRVAARA
jgi:TPR repeat protein